MTAYGLDAFLDEPDGSSTAKFVRRPLILHITGDYPDPVRDRTTLAVKNFINLLDDCDHIIVSLKRRAHIGQCYLQRCEGESRQTLFALGYWSLPAGVFHRNAMNRVAIQVRSIIADLGVRPDLIMAHKLTIEGVVAYRLWQFFGIPYVCSVRGEVEDKFFRFKPELRSLFGKVIAQAEALLFVSAWFRKRIEARYPGLVRRQALLPNFSTRPATTVAVPRDDRAMVSVLDLNMYRRKGLHDLIAALAETSRKVSGIRLDIIGWSRPEITARLQRMVDGAGVAPSVRFLGVMTHEEVLRAMPRYGALVLPARKETFGMVYVEALLSGLPILYTAESGIDGYLDGLDVGVRVPMGDVRAIAEGLHALVRDGQRYRNTLLGNYERVRERFAPEPHLCAFRKLLFNIMEQRNGGHGQ
ncbi:MAG: glycosyltransferase family 4 protein [Alphaproteobacteria bacterium]|nr:glycosyltransferase family 4 protein [Alphaproteobacteria bacterium]